MFKQNLLHISTHWLCSGDGNEVSTSIFWQLWFRSSDLQNGCSNFKRFSPQSKHRPPSFSPRLNAKETECSCLFGLLLSPLLVVKNWPHFFKINPLCATTEITLQNEIFRWVEIMCNNSHDSVSYSSWNHIIFDLTTPPLLNLDSLWLWSDCGTGYVEDPAGPPGFLLPETNLSDFVDFQELPDMEGNSHLCYSYSQLSQ